MAPDSPKLRTLWLAPDGWSLEVIDQRRLPHVFEVARLQTVEKIDAAIRSMLVRGAPLIGVVAAYGVAFAMRTDASDAALEAACAQLAIARPTAVNLRWALAAMEQGLRPLRPAERSEAAHRLAGELCEREVIASRAIGEHGTRLLDAAAATKTTPGPLNVLTHCNAGWLATVEWGTALAPIYVAHAAGRSLHVWVDETRPRNQGASLTAWELSRAGVPHTVIVDNAGGHLMQHGLVDLCIVGSDRTTRRGDVCNKIGTYLKALAAHDNRIPFYAAVPLSSIDWSIDDGVREIPIEERDPREVTEVSGRLADGSLGTVRVVPEGSPASNFGFDVTPSRLVTAIITERGVFPASEEGLRPIAPKAASVLSGRKGAGP